MFLDAMESGRLDYDEVLWERHTQFLKDCRVWSMQKAETYGLTNQCSKAHGLF